MPDPTPLIGRERALATGLEQLKRIEHGGSRCLLVRGEAGIGKTRLAGEVAARARDVGHPVLVGRADEFDRGIPYALFRDVLARLDAPADSEVAELVASLRQGLDAGAGAGGAPADAHLRLVFGRAVEAFRALTSGSPTVLLVEDAHLADADSLALVALLARLGELPLLTIVTLRPSAAASAREVERLFERMAEDAQGAVIDLEPLDRHDVQVLVKGALDAAPDARLVDATFAQSGGNPFFAAEAVRALRDAGAVEVSQGTAHLVGEGQGLTPSATLRTRVLGSDPAGVELAKVVSAFGRFDLRHLPLAARLTGHSPDSVEATFDRLVREHVLIRGGDGGYEFAHGIVRDAVYDEIGPAERRRLHGAIAEELAGARRAGALLDIATLATHVAESADPGDERAVEVLLEAGRTVSATAPLVAAEHYGHAARLLAPESPRRAEALALRARALHIGSRSVEAAATGREALATLPQGPVRRATVGLVVNGLSIAGRTAEALEVIEGELDHERDSVTLLAQRVHLLQSSGRPEEALALLPEAVAAYRDAGGSQLSAATHLLVYSFDTGEIELAEELLAQLEEWTRTGAPERRVIAHETIAVLDRRPGVVDSLERHLAAARERRPEAAPPSIGGHYETALALLALLRGDWDEALALCRSAPFELEQRGAAVFAQALHATECEILVERGAVDEAAALSRSLVALTEELNNPVALSRARVARSLGETGEAIALLSEQRERARERRTNWNRPELLGELAELLFEAGRVADARAVLEEVEGEAQRPARFEWPLVALRLRALLWDDVDAARAYFELAGSERMPFQRARAGLLLGSLDVDPALHLTEAYRAFDALGAGPWRRRAAGALRERGITVPRPAAREGGEILTDTEAKLVRLVREGLTNKQIGSALHYSPKTVEVYLSRIYAKTSCASRVELVRAVDEGTVDLPAAD